MSIETECERWRLLCHEATVIAKRLEAENAELKAKPEQQAMTGHVLIKDCAAMREETEALKADRERLMDMLLQAIPIIIHEWGLTKAEAVEWICGGDEKPGPLEKNHLTSLIREAMKQPDIK